jgi:hypothetical protein
VRKPKPALIARTIVGGEAYGGVADALFGITGAFAVDWTLGVLVHSTVITIWGAAALPLLAHWFAEHRISA